MVLFRKGIGAFGIALILIGLVELLGEQLKRIKRENTSCKFADGLSEAEFRRMAERACERIEGTWILMVNGPVVWARHCPRGGKEDWCFELDFNDHGYVTGKHRITSENRQSAIPKTLGQMIKFEIELYRGIEV